jgi:hypothetical protein
MVSGSVAGVFIDDTGSPGYKSTPEHLHPERKTWVGVVIPAAQMADVARELPGAVSELSRQTGATEFHFADIYGGRRQFKGVALQTRIALFEFMGSIEGISNKHGFIAGSQLPLSS